MSDKCQIKIQIKFQIKISEKGKTNFKLHLKGASDDIDRGNDTALKIHQDVGLIRGSGMTLICGGSRQFFLIISISIFILKSMYFFSEEILGGLQTQ